MNRTQRVKTTKVIIKAMADYPYPPISSFELEGETLFGWDSRTWTRLLKQLETHKLVKRIPPKPGEHSTLWYLPGEEPYVLENRFLTEAEEEEIFQSAMRKIDVLAIMKVL